VIGSGSRRGSREIMTAPAARRLPAFHSVPARWTGPSSSAGDHPQHAQDQVAERPQHDEDPYSDGSAYGARRVTVSGVELAAIRFCDRADASHDPGQHQNVERQDDPGRLTPSPHRNSLLRVWDRIEQWIDRILFDEPGALR
jgi:hypothetical protein